MLIFVTIGLSVFITPLLSHIPMPVLFGVFLYMGVASLKGLQFFDRILIMFMPAKYQPDYMFLRQVPILRVHMFTMIQLACLAMLWIIKSFSKTSILFPLMVRAGRGGAGLLISRVARNKAPVFIPSPQLATKTCRNLWGAPVVFTSQFLNLSVLRG